MSRADEIRTLKIGGVTEVRWSRRFEREQRARNSFLATIRHIVRADEALLAGRPLIARIWLRQAAAMISFMPPGAVFEHCCLEWLARVVRLAEFCNAQRSTQ